MDPLSVLKIEIWQQKFFGKDWKSYIAAIFGESEFGRARIELFTSPKKIKAMEPHRTILLDQCIAIKSLRNGEEHPQIRLRMKDDAELRLRCDQHSQLMTCLSTAAFPKKWHFSDDEYPVLLVPSTLTTKRNLAEGNYSLRFSKEDLSLTHGNTQVQHFPYHDILWAAAGENSLGIAVENCGLYEFICDQPLLIIDHMRNYIRFKNSFPAVRLSTKRKYNRFYHQAREIATSGSDLSNSKKKNSNGVRTDFEENADSEWLRLPVPPKALNGVEHNERRIDHSVEVNNH
ncbi:unnamed protein product, partial [Strongylus vulgaris]